MSDTATQKDRKALATINRHAESRQSIALALLKALLGLWGGFNSWDDRDKVFGHAARSAVLVDASLAKTRRLARSYGTTMLRTVDAMPAKTLKPVEDIYPRSGTDTVEVYSRPADTFLWAIKQGKSIDEATALAEKRLAELAAMDIMLAERDELQATFAQAPKVIGTRRVIHPELSASGFSCGLCVVISSRVYQHIDKMAVHDGCNCTLAPFTSGFDPALKLNEADLKAFYDAAGGTGADYLRDVSVTVREHGELGPILVNADHNFRTAEDASKSSRHTYEPFAPRTKADQRASWARMVDRAERSVQLLTEALERGDASTVLTSRGQSQTVSDFDTAIKFHNDLISRYTDALKNI